MQQSTDRIYLGIDIGGTAVKMGFLTGAGEILETADAGVAFDGYETPILQTVKKEAAAFCDRFFAAHPERKEKFAAAGVSATGQIDMEHGVVTGAAEHIRNWKGSRIAEELEEVLKVPVRVGNDANCAALGEYWLGAARGEENVIAFTVGTGVGGGIIMDGRLLLGAHGIAGELGHMIIRGDGELCSCGNRGCLERYGATSALIRMVRAGVEEGRIPCFAEEISGRTIFAELQQNGNRGPLADTVHRWMTYLADGLVGLVHIFNPSMILIGGGVSAQEELFVRPLGKMVTERVMPSYREGLRIEKALLGNKAGMAGAVYLCREQNL